MPSLSDLPPPPRPSRPGTPRVVTLGGGHGQATLLSALARLDVSITAIVSVADDGGCSGKLRQELGMPPPGDVRRCLASLATERAMADRFEERLTGGAEEGRCVGNLVIAAMYQDLGDLQRAVDWAGTLLGCVGRVVPVADAPGTLGVWDLEHGVVMGESNIERTSGRAIVAAVHGPERASAHALEAIARADVVFFGPGSFVGSTLAVLTTCDVARAVADAKARRVLVQNLAPELTAGPGRAIPVEDHARILHDHLLIGAGGEPVSFDVLVHDALRTGKVALADGAVELHAPIADASGRMHDPARLASALERFLSLSPRAHPSRWTPSPEAAEVLERHLAAARARLLAGA